MLKRNWLKTHIGDDESALGLINTFLWGITINSVPDPTGGERWAVNGGEKVLLLTDNRECVDAFIYGMALAYSVVPDDLAAQFRSRFRTDE